MRVICFRKDVWTHYLLPVGEHGLTVSVKKGVVIDKDIVIKDNDVGAHAQPFPSWKNGLKLWWQHHNIKNLGHVSGSSTDGVVTTNTENVVNKTNEVTTDVQSDVKNKTNVQDGVTSDNTNMD